MPKKGLAVPSGGSLFHFPPSSMCDRVHGASKGTKFRAAPTCRKAWLYGFTKFGQFWLGEVSLGRGYNSPKLLWRIVDIAAVSKSPAIAAFIFKSAGFKRNFFANFFGSIIKQFFEPQANRMGVVRVVVEVSLIAIEGDPVSAVAAVGFLRDMKQRVRFLGAPNFSGVYLERFIGAGGMPQCSGNPFRKFPHCY